MSPMQNCQSLVQGRGMANGMGEGERSVAMENLKVLKVEYEIYKLEELKTLSHHNSKYYYSELCNVNLRV